LEMTLLALPLGLAGLYFYLFSPQGKPYRALGFLYLVPLALFLIAKGRGYYLAPAYPMLYAAGAAHGEQWLSSLRPQFAKLFRSAVFAALALSILAAASLSLPVGPINSPWWQAAVQLGPVFPEELGWPELVESLAHIRDSLPAADRA